MTATVVDRVELSKVLAGVDTVGTSSGPGRFTLGAQGVLLSSVMLLAGTGTVGVPINDVASVRLLAPVISPGGGWTTSGAAAQAAPGAATLARVRRECDEVRWLHQESGLTWEQIGRVFGVSRRAVHMWAGGARMNATNAETLFALVDLVREVPGETPEERRASLLRPVEGGSSALETFRTMLPARAQINRPDLRAIEAIDAPVEDHEVSET